MDKQSTHLDDLLHSLRRTQQRVEVFIEQDVSRLLREVTHLKEAVDSSDWGAVNHWAIVASQSLDGITRNTAVRVGNPDFGALDVVA